MKPETLKVIGELHAIFTKRSVTMSAAESCTGGLVSHYATSLPGASGFFIAGIVSYSPEMKKNLLHIPGEVLMEKGVVSRETAVEMSRKMRVLANTDYAVSTTGNLGPDVIEGKDRGLVYVAASHKARTEVRELRLRGGREENKEDAAVAALKLLIELVEGTQ